MKANELMIGDWVIRKRDKRPMTVVELTYAETIAAITPDDVYYGDMQDYHESEVEPIPLTPEILEKNGFVRPDARLRYFTKSDDYFDVAIHEITDSIWYFEYQNCEFNLPPCSVLVAHVHELQHALRLCGIDKEIVI